MKDNTHIIQKQLVELTVPRNQNTLALQQRFGRLLEEQLLPRLEPIFDQLAGPDEWIDIDKLELDLGELPLQQAEEQWVDKAYTLFHEALKSTILKPETQRESHLNQKVEALEHFLQYGYLPWWAAEIDLEQLVQEQIARQPLKVLALLASSVARNRWIRQFAEEFQRALLKALSITLPVSLKTWRDILAEGSLQQSAFLYWQSTWEAAQQSEVLADEWKEKLTRNLLSAYPGVLKEKKLRKKLAENGLLPEASEKAFLETPKPQSASDSLQITPSRDPDGIYVPPQSASDSLQITPSRDPDGIYVPLAGTVLVHPFLPTLFKELGVLDGERFKDFQAQERAVHLLYYIATQQQHPLELEVVLLKLLCGLEPETPIVRKVDLNDTEIAEAERMLLALIHNWPAIEGTTPEELRGSFFIREGKLVLGDMGWHLTVEQTAFDVLISQLPWGLSPIMLPWMQRMIWVDWA